MSTEYAVLHNYGHEEDELLERSCGCPKIFNSIEELKAYCHVEELDTIVSRTVTEWRMVE